MSYFLGVDIGTTAVKGIIVSSDGEVIASHYERRINTRQDLDKHPDHPANVWFGFKDTVRHLLTLAPKVAVNLSAISISGIVPNVCLLDDKEAVHEPIMRYSDRRAFNIETALDRQLNNGQWQNEVLSKLIWLKENTQPAIQGRLRLFSPHTWITYKLTGKYVMDRVSAIEHGCVFDKLNQRWNQEIISKYAIDFLELPSVASPFAIIGSISKCEAEVLGVNDSAQIVVGAPDFFASLLGSGVRDVEDVMVYLGTYHCACKLTCSLPSIDSGNLQRHPIDWLATIPQAGPQCELAAELVTGCSGKDAWKQLEQLCGVESQSDGRATFVPCVEARSATISTTPTSAFFFSTGTTKPAMARAIFDAIAVGLRLDLHNRGNSIEGKRVFISGGACRSPLQRQALSDALGVPLTFYPAAEDSLGSALVAMRALTPEKFALLDLNRSWERVVVNPQRQSNAMLQAASLYENVTKYSWSESDD